MSVVVVGIEHPEVPLHQLEQVTVSEEALPKVLGALRDRPNLSEVVVLSTCLRTELYAVVERFHEGVADLQEFLAGISGTTEDALAPALKVLFDDDVTRHLFEVAAGLRSAVLGESEVLGQVRRAAERAEAENASGPVLTGLFRHAVKAGRRVRSETDISRGSTSLSHVAVELAESRLDEPLRTRNVVVVGAGEVAEGVVRALDRREVRDLTIANRTASNAERLAGIARKAQTVELELLPEALANCDLVFVSTGASTELIDEESLRLRRSERPLLVVDLGMPRNVDRSLASRPTVTIIDIEEMNQRARDAIERRGELVDEVMAILSSEVERYRTDERARGAAPVVSALRQRFSEICASEISRHSSRLGDLDAAQRREVESVVNDVLAKVAHHPTTVLKDTAGTPRGERLVEALRVLFDI